MSKLINTLNFPFVYKKEDSACPIAPCVFLAIINQIKLDDLCGDNLRLVEHYPYIYMYRITILLFFRAMTCEYVFVTLITQSLNPHSLVPCHPRINRNWS